METQMLRGLKGMKAKVMVLNFLSNCGIGYRKQTSVTLGILCLRYHRIFAEPDANFLSG